MAAKPGPGRLKRPVLVFPPGEYQFKRTLVLPSECVVICSAPTALQNALADELDADSKLSLAAPADRVGDVSISAEDNRSFPFFGRTEDRAT